MILNILLNHVIGHVFLIGLAAWDGYPTLKMLMEMVMTK